MNQSITKFLEFQGKTLLFLSVDGIYYIAIKPICEVLNVEYTRQFKNLKEDPILEPALAIQPMQVPNDQVRNMVCLPEHFIYGWLFSIRSESKELLEFKKECYLILYKHFHGSITARRDLLKEKAIAQNERTKIEYELKSNEKFIKWSDLKAKEMRLGKELKDLDINEISEQLSLFDFKDTIE